MLNGPAIVIADQDGKGPFHRLPVLQNVRDSGRASQIVFEDPVNPLSVTDKVAPVDVDVPIPGSFYPHHFGTVMLAAFHHFPRDNTLAQNALVAINIGDKKIEGEHPLNQPLLEVTPLTGGNDPGQTVEGEDPIGPLGVLINGKSDPPAEERLIGEGLPPPLRAPAGAPPCFPEPEHCGVGYPEDVS